MTEVMTERRLSPAAQHALDSGSDAERRAHVRVGAEHLCHAPFQL